MRLLQIRSLVIILSLALLGFSCDSNPADSGEDPATAQGRVDNGGSQNKSKVYSSGSSTQAAVEGATVTAARITSDGSLETISGAQAQTNAQGEFSLDISADAITDAGKNIIITAEKNGQQWKAYVSGELRSGMQTTLKPLTVESSGEAEVYSELVAEGQTDVVSKADVAAHIGAGASAEIRSNSQAAAAFAEAMVQEAEARAAFYAEQSTEMSSEMRQQILTAKADAQAQLASDLYVATSSEERQAAMNAFAQAIVQAHLDAGLSAATYAKAREMSSKILVEQSSSISAEAAADVRTNAALITSYALDAAVQARMEAEGASESSIQAAADAALTLRSEIRSSAEGSKQEIEAAFENYNETIASVLSQEVSASAETMTIINAEIQQSDGAKAALESSIQAAIGIEIATGAIAEAYTNFTSSVQSVVSSNYATATDAEAQLVTDVMVLINLAN